MKEFFEKNSFWIFVVLSFFIVSALLSNKIVRTIVDIHYDRIVDAVVKKLEKEYSPSPYGPGIDPDKIDVDLLLKR